MSLQSFIDTARGALTDPVASFAQMRREGGLGPPLIYYIIGMLIGMIGSMLWSVIGFGGMGMPFGGPSAGEAMGGMALIVIIADLRDHRPVHRLADHPLRARALRRTEVSVRNHVPHDGLRVRVGAADRDRPVLRRHDRRHLGPVVAIMGLAQMQETTTGKAAAAVLTPMVLCCGLIGFSRRMLFALFAVMLGRAAASSH